MLIAFSNDEIQFVVFVQVSSNVKCNQFVCTRLLLLLITKYSFTNDPLFAQQMTSLRLTEPGEQSRNVPVTRMQK